MSSLLSRAVRGIKRIPDRILDAAGWAQMEPAGLAVTPAPADLDEMEARRREKRELERKDEDAEQARAPDAG